MERSSQIVGLDLLRFAAALMVVVYHLGVRTWAADTTMSQIAGGTVHYGALSFAWIGWVGVEIFFVLSGFVIAYSAEGASALGFVRSRVLRLVPAAWICATITLAVQLALGRHDLWGEYASSMLFNPIGPWIDAPYWTLPIEIVFYAVIFAAIAFDKFRHVELIATVLGLASVTVWAGYRLGHGIYFNTNFSHLSLLQHGCFFAAGVLLWLLLRKGVTLRRLGVLALCVGAGLVEIRFMAPMKVTPGGFIYAPCLVWLAAVAAIAASVRWNARLQGPWNGAVRLLGVATYPLYLVHAAVGSAAIRLMRDLGLPQWPALAVAIVLVLALSLAIAKWAEPSLRRALARPLDWLSHRAGARYPALLARTAGVTQG